MGPNEGLFIRFILSAKSGQGLENDLAERIRQSYAAHKAARPDSPLETPDIVVTDYFGHGGDLAREWAERYGDRGLVYIGGGDGSLNEVANALAETDCAMGVIPLGTGNDFARSIYPGLKAKEATEAAVARAFEPEMTEIDLLKVNGRYCINVISLGYDTVVLKAAYDLLARFPKLGTAAYKLGVLKTLFAKKHYPLKYRLLDETGVWREAEQDAAIAVMGNGGFYGSGFNPCPDANLQDGLGDFLTADKMGLFEYVPLLLKYKNGRHLGSPKIHTFRFTKGVVRSADGEPFPANNDGEIFRSAVFELEICPRQLRFARLMPFKNQ